MTISGSGPVFTVILPVHRGPHLLPLAISTVLGQTCTDLELFIICDGAPAPTVACAHEHANMDRRIQVFESAKGDRNGESHREVALQNARGRYVCQIGDDDLWFPEHLVEMSLLLAECDFGNLIQTDVSPTGHLSPRFFDLAHEGIRKKMLTERFNFFGPTVCGYRLSAYRSLPDRWSPAPPEIYSDLFMWRKFLRQRDVRLATRHVITSLSLPSRQRANWSPEQRLQENRTCLARIDSELGRSNVRAAALKDVSSQLCDQFLHPRQAQHATASVMHRLLRNLYHRLR